MHTRVWREDAELILNIQLSRLIDIQLSREPHDVIKAIWKGSSQLEERRD